MECKKINRMLLPVLLSVLFYAWVPAATAQVKPDFDRRIAPVQLQQDFVQLRDTLQKIHAGLYRYKTPPEINQLFDSTYNSLKDSLTEMAFFRQIRHLLSGIEDGHTECFLPKELEDHLFNDAKVFPVQPLFIGQRAYIPCETNEFPAGTEILAIDHRAVREIRRLLLRYISADGAIETGKQVELNKFFFGHYYTVFGEMPAFTVAYKTISGKAGSSTINAVLVKDMQCRTVNPGIEKYLRLAYPSGHIAVLTIQTFLNDYLDATNENFKTFLAASFKAIKEKKIDRLVIDLRDNKGGQDENGALLYAYLTGKPFHYYDSLKSTTKNLAHHNLALQQPAENSYSGKVMFLINGRCFSTTAEFCAVAKSNKRGLFAGEETGGGYYGNTSGDRATVFLHNTGIRVNIPMNKYVLAVKKTRYKDRGVIPDVAVIPTIQDFLEKREPAFIEALKLMDKR